MIMTRTPSRLFVIFARNAPTAVIFRRGPTRWVQLILWHTDTNTFEPGQWFKGRIYPKRSDISPDGRYLIYYATKHKHEFSEKLPEVFRSWTAISRPPYFTALRLWGVGWEGYYGGGLFCADGSIQIDGYSDYVQEDISPEARQHTAPIHVISGQSTGHIFAGVVYDERLTRDGWVVVAGGAKNVPVIRHKADPTGHYTLVMTIGVGRYGLNDQEAYHLQDVDGSSHYVLSGTTWVDWDHRGRLAFAREGKLFVAAPSDAVNGIFTELQDFNGNVPEPIEPPQWARTW
jgi:hypothetical protein